ncbi:probable anaerobic dehydrogenase iron-sulfur-binding subunit [Natronomonas pharaonis DSM 2160]|uniref:Probable anaerobic dehydrogenase iron-sulfur-binding subunit n=1 Tax=Natronomonas pharaonis (strain ATCC 35678 / DSM 2160 / CIP 103997 / JCM 8858 / NBRC 14720 / NCIMB 2260 / Gabara) TaxID=348780 RepID=A0A1U7EZ66_NATPD|nr:4Fe-4S ferredoxin N-terminal domain-containing protein [Natronomonas pharaonis]CAI50564.1 probable anaerobic dehydrogenase iron-sulfur-binding subunit [Natronomonas pharaonis DSM 2160]
MNSDDSSCDRDSCGCGSNDEPTDESFHPMGEEWEEEMREKLEETEYDADLGMEMAEDAMRLIQGELSEAEFHDRYNDAVVEEFDVDDRPTAEAYEEEMESDDGGLFQRLTGEDGTVGKLSDFDPDTDQTRRDTMKKMGAGAAALGFSGVASAASPTDDEYGDNPVSDTGDDDDVQMGMVIDLERCDGCLECVTGCIEENQTSEGANWMYVLTYEDEQTEQENFLVRPCQHCSNAPCEKVCPVRARHTRDKDGLVLTNYEVCIGCRYCQVACPYGVNYFQWGEPDVPYEDLPGSENDYDELKEMPYEERQEHLKETDDHLHDERGQWNDMRPAQGTMGKCTFCPSRQDGHQGEEKVGTVACMEACDTAGMSAIHFGDVNDPDSRPNQFLEQRAEEALENEDGETNNVDIDEDWGESNTPWGGKLSAFKLLDDLGTQPNVTYLGNEPGPEAEQVEGPVTYEQIGVQDDRKEHLDQLTFGTGDD